MTCVDSVVDRSVVRGARAGVGPGYTLEAAAVRLAEDIAELRNDGGIPAQVRTVITVMPWHRVLEIRVAGLSAATDPDRTIAREVTTALFELASDYNIIALDIDAAPPLFTQRILLLDNDGRPFHALVGVGVGETETVTHHRCPSDG